MNNKYELIYEGKAKKVFSHDDKDKVLIEFKDDATAFNALKKAQFEGKGKLNCLISARIFELLKKNNIRSSIFIDPDKSQLDAAKDIGVDRVEIYTGPFAEAYKKNDENMLNIYKEAVEYGNDIELELNAGHDLNLENLSTLLSYGDIKEISIGHALITESLIYGIENTIQNYIKLIQ